MTDDNKKKYLEWLKVAGTVLLLFFAILVLSELFDKGGNAVAKVAAAILSVENGYFAYKAIKKQMDEYNQP